MRKVAVAVAGLAVTLTGVLSGCASHGSGKALPAPSTTTATTAEETTTSTTPSAPGTFLVAKPTISPLQYAATPGGAGIATLPTVTWGNPTVRPVLDQTADWVQIELDTKPNLSTGWVPRSAVDLASTSYRIEISISKRSLSLFDNGDSVYSAPVGVGAPQWPTPMGRTFVDAVVATPKFELNTFGPTVLILGAHSDVLTDFDKGDGTVAIHGYPSDPASTMGVASSHGCVRASPQTIDAIDAVPLGTPVDVVA